MGISRDGGMGAVRGMRLRLEQLTVENERLRRELAAARAACVGYVASQMATVTSGTAPLRDELGLRRVTRAIDGGQI